MDASTVKCFGRPSVKVEINFKNPQNSIDQIEYLCKNEVLKENVRIFAKALLNLTDETVGEGTQTEATENFIDEIFFENLKAKSNEEQSHIISSMCYWVI